jgi:hypothetical protein
MNYADQRSLRLQGGPPWGKVRSLDEILADHSHDRVISGHIRSGIDLTGHTVIFIYRYPRDVLISYARWRAANWNSTHVDKQREPARAEESGGIRVFS